MENPTNYRSDLNSDDQFLMHDAIEDARDDWEPEYPSDDDAFFCYEDGDEWLGTGGDWETGDWIGPSDADGGL